MGTLGGGCVGAWGFVVVVVVVVVRQPLGAGGFRKLRVFVVGGTDEDDECVCLEVRVSDDVVVVPNELTRFDDVSIWVAIYMLGLLLFLFKRKYFMYRGFYASVFMNSISF